MDPLIVERSDGVVQVTFNRPDKKNALNNDLLVGLLATFREVEASDDDRVLVLTGAGGSFSSGADLSDHDGPATDRSRPALSRMHNLNEVALALHRITKPTVAKVDGVAVGAGLSLALGCDLVVVSDRVRLSTIFAKRSLSLDFGASWLLPRLVGMARAKELALLSEFLDGPTALAMGLVNRVVPVDELDAFVDGWARTLAHGPTLALAGSKALLNESLGRSMTEALESEARSQAYNMGTEDGREALDRLPRAPGARLQGSLTSSSGPPHAEASPANHRRRRHRRRRGMPNGRRSRGRRLRAGAGGDERCSTACRA